MDTVVPGNGTKPRIKILLESSGNTILGADDKSGLSIILEIEFLRKYPHVNLEVAITTCEEIGLLGTKYLDYKLLNKSGLYLTVQVQVD